MTYLADIPSPTTSVWHLGPLPLRAYALCILLGMVVACVVTERRLRARGGPEYLVLDLAIWAIPAGIIGARIYSLITSPQDYFGAGHGFWEWAQIWHGGLAIWGAVLGGAVGAYIGCRQRGIPLLFLADAAAVGLPLAQAIGRVGNYFNNELYGKATTLPWGLKVYHIVDGSAERGRDGKPLPVDATHPDALYHPTFLYEALWCVGVALLVWSLDRRFKFSRGRAFALYVMAYTAGRFWIEALRIDEANKFLGIRVNDFVAVLVFLAALAWFVTRRGGVQQRIVVNADGTLRMVDAPEGAEAATADARANGEPTTAPADDITDSAEDSDSPDPADSAGTADSAESADTAEEPDAEADPEWEPAPLPNSAYQRPVAADAEGTDADSDSPVSPAQK